MQYFECQPVKPMGKRSEFVIAFKNIDEEKNREFARQRKIEAALDEVRKINRTLQYEMSIAGALSKDYPNVVLPDPANDTVMTIKVEVCRAENKDGRAIAEHFTNNGCWSEGLRSYAREHVPEKSRSEFIEQLSLDRIPILL